MRNLIIAAIGAAAITASAAPAQPQYYGHRHGDRGYRNGDVSGLENRIHNVLNSLGGVRPDQREPLREEAFSLGRQLRYAERNGLNPYEAQRFDQRIGRLEQRLQWASGNGRYGHNDRRWHHDRNDGEHDQN